MSGAEWLWAFLNSPVGVTIIGGFFAYLLGKVVTAKPEWETVFNRYRGLFFDAVRAAEKAVPDNAENKTARKADEALKWLLKIEPGLNGQKGEVLNRALAEAHDMIRKKLPTISHTGPHETAGV